MLFDFDMMQIVYKRLEERLPFWRNLLKRPLTLSEKIIFCHLDKVPSTPATRGKDWIFLNPDRVALQDVTAQMTLLQFMVAGKTSSHAPTTVHCDHLIQAELGAGPDLARAQEESKEVFDFLQTACAKYGLGFWKPGAGIIHQVVLENYAFPGGLMIGTDSHTPNAGGLGMMAVGVGGADAVDVMAGMPWELKMPKLIAVRLTGKLHGWTSAKDIILKVASILTVKGGTGAIIEYIGPGARTLSATGKATICNMGAEVGATTSLFPFDHEMADYLKATGREIVAEAALARFQDLEPDPEVEADPSPYYDQVIEIDLDLLQPMVNGPYTPDRCWSIHELGAGAIENDFPMEISVGLIGSCTNSSYEDIERACSLAKQALDKGLRFKCPVTVTPGSNLIYETMKARGHLELLEKTGAQVLANACGPCIGQWKRHDIAPGERNTIVTSFNRNFSGRNDANPGTHSFVTSPELTLALALAGRLDFNPLQDTLTAADGSSFKLLPPSGESLPSQGFPENLTGFVGSKANPSLSIVIDPSSQRLSLLQPFAPWNGKDFKGLRILVKAKGKCTTDHISPAGSWLKYRGHLDKISDNMLSGATNAFCEKSGYGINHLTQNQEPLSQIARAYKAKGVSWVVIGDENYGEGSSREHAAMEPRHLGSVAIICKSFARIHETNLKKHGLLALTFANPEDYHKLRVDDWVDLLGLEKLHEGSEIILVALHSDGSKDEFALRHSLNSHQINWFKAGSALNEISLRKTH
jgi:aconitate hydratase